MILFTYEGLLMKVLLLMSKEQHASKDNVLEFHETNIYRSWPQETSSIWISVNYQETTAKGCQDKMSGNPGREGLKGSELSIAIIGAGVTGLSLAVGLASRGVHVTVYERASRSRDISAGIGFTPNAERAMKALDDRIYRHFRQIAVQNGDDWFRYVNGLSRGGGNPEELDQDVIFKIYLGERGFEGCRRTDFNAGLIEFLPPGTIKYGKTLTAIEDGSHDCKVTLQFEDGSSAEANGGELQRIGFYVCQSGLRAGYSELTSSLLLSYWLRRYKISRTKMHVWGQIPSNLYTQSGLSRSCTHESC